MKSLSVPVLGPCFKDFQDQSFPGSPERRGYDAKGKEVADRVLAKEAGAVRLPGNEHLGNEGQEQDH
jgi:hypothetical protein